MRYPDDDVDDFYPQDLDLPASKSPKPQAEGSARLRLIPGGPEYQRQRKFYLFLLLSLFLCLALGIWVFVNRAERQRLTSAATQVNEEIRQTEERMAEQTPPMALDGELMARRADLEARSIEFVRQINQKSHIPYFFYIPLTLVLSVLLINTLTMASQIGKTVFEFLKGGVCLLATSLTVLGFNLAFIWYFFTLQIWLFSIAFALMLISIILIISPNLFMLFTGPKFRRNTQKVETLEELQERLPFDD